jgi:hypothetical protein
MRAHFRPGAGPETGLSGAPLRSGLLVPPEAGLRRSCGGALRQPTVATRPLPSLARPKNGIPTVFGLRSFAPRTKIRRILAINPLGFTWSLRYAQTPKTKKPQDFGPASLPARLWRQTAAPPRGPGASRYRRRGNGPAPWTAKGRRFPPVYPVPTCPGQRTQDIPVWPQGFRGPG